MTPDERDAVVMRSLRRPAADLRTRATNIARHADWLSAHGSSEEARAYGRAVALSCHAARRVGLERSDPAANRDTLRDAVACVRSLVNADGEDLEVVLDHSEDATALACAIAGLTAELLLRQSPETRTAILQVWTEEASRPDGGGE